MELKALDTQPHGLNVSRIYKYYKAEVCGVENRFVYIPISEYITD